MKAQMSHATEPDLEEGDRTHHMEDAVNQIRLQRQRQRKEKAELEKMEEMECDQFLGEHGIDIADLSFQEKQDIRCALQISTQDMPGPSHTFARSLSPQPSTSGFSSHAFRRNPSPVRSWNDSDDDFSENRLENRTPQSRVACPIPQRKRPSPEGDNATGAKAVRLKANFYNSNSQTPLPTQINRRSVPETPPVKPLYQQKPCLRLLDQERPFRKEEVATKSSSGPCDATVIEDDANGDISILGETRGPRMIRTVAMATGGADLLTELCADVLSCEICSEDFNWDTHTPRILPCYHCFCETCLDQLNKDGSLQCPKCRSDIQVTGKFPVETTRMALMDKKRALQSQKGVPCEGCTEGARATSRCQDCEEFLCEYCSTAHRRMKASNDHTLVSFDEAAKNIDKLLQRSEKCERHSDRKLDMFCVTCSTAVCITCVVTLHQHGHKIVEMSTVLDKQKREMLALCDKLDEVQQSFQAKAEESEASVEAVESNLNEAVNKVESVFSEIISTATERQAEVIGDLRAKAMSDKLQLGEQSTTFRSLQAAAHTASQYGRRCVALSLASQMFSHSPQLTKTIQELSEKTTAEVKHAPTYEVMVDNLEELKALIKEIEVTGSKRVLSSVSMPSIQLDASRCAPDCCLGEDNCSLSNQPCTHNHPQPQSGSVLSDGTCGTEALPGSSSYWQVRCRAEPKPLMKDGDILCGFGVATQAALGELFRDDYDFTSGTDHCALFILILISKGLLTAAAVYKTKLISFSSLAPFSPRSSVDMTLGLLLDTATSRLHLIDVTATRVLCSSNIDLSTPLWPFVSVETEDTTGARVDVEVQSGQQIEMSRNLVRLLRFLL